MMRQSDYSSSGQAPRWDTFIVFEDHAIAKSAVDSIFPPDGHKGISNVQQVISMWLVERAGMPFPYRSDDPAISAAADRFAALPTEAQRAWLELNWDALRAGELTLDQMP